MTGPAAGGWDPFDRALMEAADELLHEACLSDGTWKGLAARFDKTPRYRIPRGSSLTATGVGEGRTVA